MAHASPQKLLGLMTEQSQKVAVLKAEVAAIGSGKALDHVLLETHVGGVEALNKQVRDALTEIVVLEESPKSGTLLDHQNGISNSSSDPTGNQTSDPSVGDGDPIGYDASDAATEEEVQEAEPQS